MKIGIVVATLALGAAALGAQPAVVRGTVRAPDGRPLPFAEVIVNDSTRTRADSAGAFTLGAVATGDVSMLVRRVGYLPLSVPLHLEPGQRRTLAIELAVLPYAVDPVIVSARRPGIYGQVVDERGEPILGAEIIVAGAGRRVTSAKDGGFSMPELRASSYMLLVRAADRLPANFSVTLPPDRGQELRVQMWPLERDVRDRRAAAGFFWTDEAHMRDLDRRLRENHGAMLSRAMLETKASAPFEEVMRDAATVQKSLALGTSGPTSLQPEGTSGGTGAVANTTVAGDLPVPTSLGTQTGYCYFIDGEPAAREQLPMLQRMPASFIESIEIVPNDRTLTLNRRLPAGSSCSRFIVVWLRR